MDQNDYIRTLCQTRLIEDGRTVEERLAAFDSVEATLTTAQKSAQIETLKSFPKSPEVEEIEAQFPNVDRGSYVIDGVTYEVGRPKGWEVGSDGWYFVKSDGQPVGKAKGYGVMTAIVVGGVEPLPVEAATAKSKIAALAF